MAIRPTHPKTIGALRSAGGPMEKERLAVWYDDAAGLEDDLRRLHRHGLVAVQGGRVVWQGS